MNIFHVPANLVDRVGWVLVHSAWQFALIALLALMLMHVTRRCSAASRYCLLLLALAAMVASPIVTLLVMSRDESMALATVDEQASETQYEKAAAGAETDVARSQTGESSDGSLTTSATTSVGASEASAKNTPAVSWRTAVDQAVRPWLSVIVGIWCLGVMAFAWRPLLSWHTVRRLRRVGVSPVPDAVASMLRRTSERLRLRQTVQILQSTLTRVPVVIGYLRPVILLPVSVIAGVPTSQLEAILAHELAHVRRHDFLVNLLQTLFETLFFYHPAVWWLSHRIRVERENCCDDLVVSVLGNRVEYGRALLAIEELRGTTTALALGARGGSLLDRVQRLFRRDPDERSVGTGVVLGLGLLALVLIAVGVWNSTQADDDGTTPGATAKLEGGVEIKLLGLSYQPSEKQPWWTPEGGALAADPLANRGWGYSQTRNLDAGEHRELALEIAGAEHDVHAWVDFAPGDKLGMWSTFWNFQDDEKTKKKLTLVRAVSAGFPKAEKQRDVLVRLAVAPWHPYQVIDLKREKPQPDEKPAEKPEDGTVQFRRVHERTDGTTQVDLVFPAKFELRSHHQVVAQDVDGNEVKLQGTTIADADARGDARARGWIFRCPLDRLAKVLVRFHWFTHEVTFRNVSLHPEHVTQVTAKVTKLEPPPLADAEVVAERFRVALKRQALHFLDQPRIEALQSELRDDVAKSSKTLLADAEREALMVAIDGFVAEHFRADAGDYVYLKFRDEFETLKWQLRIAMSRAPLTDTELARREHQRQWMDNAIKALPELPKFQVTHKVQLEKLGQLLSDPLNPFFASPLSEPDFVRFQKAFEEDVARVGAGKSLSYAASWLTKAAVETQIESLLRDWPVKNLGHHRTNTRWSLIVTRSVGNTTLQLEDVNSNVRHVYADVMQNIFVAGDAPANLAEREAWLLKQPNGDLCFDAKLDALVGVRGAKLAVLEAPNWYEADRVSLADLRQLIDKHGQASLPLSHFAEPQSPEEPVRRPKKPRPSLVVRSGSGGISVIRLGDVDSLVIMSRPRPLLPNLPLHSGDQQEEPLEARTKYSANLPIGVEVELAGVSMANVSYPDLSQRRKADAWWRADGTRLQAPPMKLFSAWVDEQQKYFREFAIKLTPARDATSITANYVTWTPAPPRGSSGLGGWDTSDSEPGFLKLQHTAGFKDDKPVAVHVFVSDQPLGPAWLIDVNGRALPQEPADAKTESLRKLIEVVGVEKADNETIFRSNRLPADLDWRLEFNVRAIDQKDQPHSSRESRGSEAGDGRVFKLAAADIKHFEIRLRPMTQKITFENVSLLPGQVTDVKVKVEPIDLLALSGLEFLKPYPKLHGLSLDMTEPQFLEIVKPQELKTRKTVEGEKITHHIALGDDHTLIVMFDKDAKCSGIQRVHGEDNGAGVGPQAPVEKTENPHEATLKTLDTAAMAECRGLIKRFDEAGDVKPASMARERLAKRWKWITEQPVASFLRELPKKVPNGNPEDGRGPLVGVQTELDGVWSNGKGTADDWKDWIVRKQNGYRVGRLQLLFEAAQGYRKTEDAASAKRVLQAGLSGHEIYDADLKTLIGKYWPVTNDEPAKSMGPGPEAWTLANYLGELSSAQQALGEIDQAILTHSRLTFAHFMLSWNQPSAGPTKHARELWALIRQRPEPLPPLFWFNVIDEKNSQQKFDLSGAGQKGKPLTYHHYNLTAAPSLNFAELTITARTRGRKGILDCYRINADGKHETIILLQPSAAGEPDQTLTKTLQVPAGTGLVQFMVAGEDFQVGEVTVEAKFVQRATGGRGKLNAEIKVGMTFDELIALKGRHYRLSYGMREGNLILVYDDIAISVDAPPNATGGGKVTGFEPGIPREVVQNVPDEETSPPKGLEFLKLYPKLHGLSLDMTEAKFLEIVKQQELKTRRTVESEKVTHHIELGDGQTLIVMFDKEGNCKGIQRVRGDDEKAEDRGRAAPQLGAIQSPAKQAFATSPTKTRPQTVGDNETTTPPTIAPSTTPVDDVFDGPVTTAESGYPVIKQIAGELPDGWIACEFGLQYRVRAETTSLVAGELPLLFVDVRNRGTFKDMGLELHQSRHSVDAGGNRYERRDQPWAGVAPLEPEGKPLTLAFALSEDWKREGETKTPLKLTQGKYRIALSLMIAPVYPSPDEPQTTPASRKPIFRSLVCRPIEIEIRSGAWSGPPGSLGLENIRREVIAIPDFHSPKVPPNLQRLVHEHQPAAGDFLVKLIKSDDPSVPQAASVVFADAWDSMNREQIENYLLATMTHFVWQRSQYPQGVDAMIGMGPRHRPGYLGMPPDRKYSAETITTLKLDGVQVDQPIKYPGLGSLSHWLKTKDLSLGRHTLRLATKFTFTRGTETYRGEYDSPEFAFEMVPANTPDDLIAPHDEQLDRLVREALLFAETEYALNHLPGRENFNRLQPEPPESEKWIPQIRWGDNKLGLSSLHCPVWKLAKRLPVDLCFAVEFHIENSDARIRCNDFVSVAVEGERGSYFSPQGFNVSAEMIKHADKDGFVTGRLVLKPSRAAALTDPKVKRYFGGEITSQPLRFKVVVSSNAPANQNR